MSLACTTVCFSEPCTDVSYLSLSHSFDWIVCLFFTYTQSQLLFKICADLFASTALDDKERVKGRLEINQFRLRDSVVLRASGAFFVVFFFCFYDQPKLEKKRK